jgi:putative sulfotransferase
MDAPFFIVGTGRCGSTMLSEFLQEHDSVLSLSEFFCFATDLGGRIAYCFPSGVLDGSQLWQVSVRGPSSIR